MRLQVFHRTTYTYAGPVRESFNEARLQPADTDGQKVQHFLLKVLPPTRLTHYFDFYRNCVHLFEVPQSHAELVVEASSIVTTRDQPALAAGAPAVPLADMGACARVDRCYDFLQTSHYVETSPEVWRLAVDAAAGRTDAWQVAQALTAHVHREFAYRPHTTHSHTHMREVLRLRAGVCQDFAHVLLGMCRSLRIPARYASGYLYNGPADELKGAQASHAWVEVYLPGAGWIGLDPTNNRIVDGHYVRVAVGRDYADVPPVKGTYRGAGSRTLGVDVLVTRLDNEPVALSPA